MKVFGRKLLDYNTEIAIDVDEIVFEIGGPRHTIVVSLYRAKKEDIVEVRCSEGPLTVFPRSANLVHVGSKSD